MADSQKSGQLDLEKELTCSICTEVLYQPLTLLDCLHSFCGSCLKFWFQWQAAQNRDPRKNPYTCPSCRASVRATSSDAKINTLLEMFLLANPTKGKAEEEKKDVAGKYTKGEDVIPKLDRTRNEADEADRRMIEEVRQMSVRDLDSRSHHHSYERGVRHRHRSRDRRHAGGSEAAERAGGSSDSRSQARHIEHQSSLRSLISTDEVSSAEMQEEILRQIAEEGLLDGIEIDDLTAAQYDELSERIAEAYRLRHQRGTQSPRTRHTDSPRATLSPPNTSSREASSSSSRRHARSTSASGEATRSSRPPTSHRQLLDIDGNGAGHRRRRSSETRRQTSPTPRSAPTHHQAARSATDLSTHERTTAARERRHMDLGIHARSNTDPRVRQVGDSTDRHRRDTPRRLSPLSTARQSPHQTPDSDIRRPSDSAPETVRESETRRPSAMAPEAVVNNDTRRPSEAAPEAVETDSSRPTDPRPPESSPSSSARGRPPTYSEPSISCDRCGKREIQYELHESCSICNSGNYNLCHRCYREGKGCLEWSGFGISAVHRFQRSVPQPATLHTLIGHQYLRPHPASIVLTSSNPPASSSSTSTSQATYTTESPAKRLLTGAFCSLCSSPASDCFWHCSWCNDGEWGYCNNCVNTGHCCTHPLLPLAHVSAAKSQTAFPSTHASASFAPITSLAMLHTYPPSNISDPGQYRPLTFSTTCDICHYPVQPNQSRYHCYTCQGGDYDVCNLCYSKLVASGKLQGEDGDKGWRRCARGHRMIKFFFEDTNEGQRRIVVNDLVGGWLWEDRSPEGDWAWRDKDGARKTRSLSRRLFEGGDEVQGSSASGSGSGATGSAVAAGIASGSGSKSGQGKVMMQRFPPDGGVGMKALAVYPRLPAEGAQDELAFPRGAEIREAMEISEDWYQGAYAGSKGLFPSNHVRVIDVVTM